MYALIVPDGMLDHPAQLEDLSKGKLQASG